MINLAERLRVLSRMFTRPTLMSLARSGDWEDACSFLHQYGLVKAGKKTPLYALFDAAWNQLCAEYRSEYVYKNEVANRLIFGLHSPRVAALHLELPVGKSIVDVAVYNGHSTAYEIKTEFDSARRLQTQAPDYMRAFERVFVVTHPKFAEAYASIVPESVGVIALNRRGNLSTIKQAQDNSDRLDRTTMFRCMRRGEYLRMLSPIAPELHALPNGRVAEESQKIVACLETDTVHAMYLSALKERSTKTDLPEFLLKLPKSLRALGCGTPLSIKQRTKLLDSLARPVSYQLI